MTLNTWFWTVLVLVLAGMGCGWAGVNARGDGLMTMAKLLIFAAFIVLVLGAPK